MENQNIDRPETPEEKAARYAKLSSGYSLEISTKGNDVQGEIKKRRSVQKKAAKELNPPVVIDTIPMERASRDEYQGSLTGKNPEEVTIGKRTDWDSEKG